MSESVEKIDITDEVAVACETLEASGVIIDDEGNKWTIPANEHEDYGDLGSLHPFGHLALDERFHYQIVALNQVPSKMTEKFVPVTRKEVKLESLDTIEREFGSFAASNVVLDSGVLMKIPKVLAERRQERKARVAREVREATEPSQEMLDRAQRKGSPRIKSASAIDKALSGGHVDSSLKHRVSNKISA